MPSTGWSHRKSWPHMDTQCASSMTKRESRPAECNRDRTFNSALLLWRERAGEGREDDGPSCHKGVLRAAASERNTAQCSCAILVLVCAAKALACA
eukprot:364197-Chlamydomonas_euryale.AAC.14